MPDKEIQEIRAAAINEFADDLIRYYKHLKGNTSSALVVFNIDLKRKEMVKGVKRDAETDKPI